MIRINRVLFVACPVFALAACGSDADQGAAEGCTTTVQENELLVECPDGQTLRVPQTGPAGDDGKPGAPVESASCTVQVQADGSKLISCSDGTNVVVRDGAQGEAGADGRDGKDGLDGTDGVDGTDGQDGTDGKDGLDGADGKDGLDGADGMDGRDGKDGAAASCTVAENSDGTHTIRCSDGTRATVRDGADGMDGTAASCTVAENGDGTYTVGCSDGTSAIVRDGAEGTPGAAGADGSGCTLAYVGRGISELRCGAQSITRIPTGYPSAIVAGWQHTCLLQRTGRVRCWGDPRALENAPAADTHFEQLAAAEQTTCGITEGGAAIACWGPLASQHPTSGGPWVGIDISSAGGCALSSTGVVDCWGNYAPYDGNVGPGATDLYVSRNSSAGWCVVNAAGRPACSGGEWNDLLIDRPPNGQFGAGWRAGRIIQVEYPCALYDDGSVDCRDDDADTSPIPGGAIARLVHTPETASNDSVCAVRRDGTAGCRDDSGYSFPTGDLVDVAVGGAHVCGLQRDDSVTCTADYPHLDRLQAKIPDADGFVRILVGDTSACAVRADGTLACFEGDATLNTPDTVFAEVDVGSFGGCGLLADGHLQCWGREGGLTPLSDYMTMATFSAISVGDGYVCGVVADQGPMFGRIQCGGKHDVTGQAAPGFIPPSGRVYTDVSVGGNRTFCMTDDEQRLSCTQIPGSPDTAPPNGQIVERFWAGYEAVCAVPVGGSLMCQDRQYFGRGMPTDTSFVELSAGRAGFCGRYDDGSVACWGSSSLRYAPTSPMTSIGVGPDFACGLDETGRILCWGKEDAGQAVVPSDL